MRWYFLLALVTGIATSGRASATDADEPVLLINTENVGKLRACSPAESAPPGVFETHEEREQRLERQAKAMTPDRVRTCGFASMHQLAAFEVRFAVAEGVLSDEKLAASLSEVRTKRPTMIARLDVLVRQGGMTAQERDRRVALMDQMEKNAVDASERLRRARESKSPKLDLTLLRVADDPDAYERELKAEAKAGVVDPATIPARVAARRAMLQQSIDLAKDQPALTPAELDVLREAR